jgi:hypothetical protein
MCGASPTPTAPSSVKTRTSTFSWKRVVPIAI